MESGGSGAGDDGVVQDAAKPNRWPGRAVAEALGISGGQEEDARWETARTDTTTGVWYDADGWCDGWTGRRLQIFSKRPKSFFNCFQYWNTGNTLFELTYSNTGLG